MGFFDKLFGGGKPAASAPASRFPKRLPSPQDLEYLEITEIEGNTVSLAMRFNKCVKPGPAPKTDIVFLLDASRSMLPLYQSGQVQDAVWNILAHTLQYDEDGIDFFLHSALSKDQQRVTAVIEKLQRRQPITNEEVFAITHVRELGQIADRADLNKALNLGDADYGLTTLCAPALEAAMAKRKPDGNLFIEVVTDGAFADKEEVKQVIAKWSRQAQQTKNPNMVRVHILGVGSELDEAFLTELDEGLSAVAPIDIVAFDRADKISQTPELVFKELERGFITVGELGTVQIKGAAPKVIRNGYNGLSDPELLSLERVPQLLTIEVEFPTLPKSFEVEVMFTDNEGDDFVVNAAVAV